MPEEQAFCLLVKIMFEYEFRDLYRDGFDNLRLKLYQLDRLVEVSMESGSLHFSIQLIPRLALSTSQKIFKFMLKTIHFAKLKKCLA
jgi:hypothetical protein